MHLKQTILHFTSDGTAPSVSFSEYLGKSFNKKVIELGTGSTEYDKLALNPDLDLVEKLTAEFDPVMVLFSYSAKTLKSRKLIKAFLNAFRELRVPYMGINVECKQTEGIKKILVPVGFLPEEKEKAPWSNSFIKYCKSEITLLKPSDRGTRSEKNVEFIEKVLGSYKNSCRIINGEKSSFGIEKEAVKKYSEENDMFIISASRAYGLDDLFFGPKEYHVLLKSRKPVLIINPRDDIYVLCGD